MLTLHVDNSPLLSDTTNGLSPGSIPKQSQVQPKMNKRVKLLNSYEKKLNMHPPPCFSMEACVLWSSDNSLFHFIFVINLAKKSWSIQDKMAVLHYTWFWLNSTSKKPSMMLWEHDANSLALSGYWHDYWSVTNFDTLSKLICKLIFSCWFWQLSLPLPHFCGSNNTLMKTWRHYLVHVEYCLKWWESFPFGVPSAASSNGLLPGGAQNNPNLWCLLPRQAEKLHNFPVASHVVLLWLQLSLWVSSTPEKVFFFLRAIDMYLDMPVCAPACVHVCLCMCDHMHVCICVSLCVCLCAAFPHCLLISWALLPRVISRWETHAEEEVVDRVKSTGWGEHPTLTLLRTLPNSTQNKDGLFSA